MAASANACDIADPALGAGHRRDHVDDGRREQQAERDQLHATQVACAFGVGLERLHRPDVSDPGADGGGSSSR